MRKPSHKKVSKNTEKGQPQAESTPCPPLLARTLALLSARSEIASIHAKINSFRGDLEKQRHDLRVTVDAKLLALNTEMERLRHEFDENHSLLGQEYAKAVAPLRQREHDLEQEALKLSAEISVRI